MERSRILDRNPDEIDGTIAILYSGNFSSGLKINEEFLTKLLEIVGESTKRKFVVADGNGSGRLKDIRNIRGWSFSAGFILEHESEIVKRLDKVVVFINGEVMSQNVRNLQEKRGKSFDFYKGEYQMRLEKAISGGLRQWSDYEIEHKVRNKGLDSSNAYLLKSQHEDYWNKFRGKVLLFE